MNLLCIHLGEGKGVVALMHTFVCIGTHSQPLLQNHLMILMKLGIDEELKAPFMF